MEPKQYYIGIDVGGTSVKEGLFDEDGNLLAKASVPTPPIVDAAGFAAVTEAIDQVVAKAQIPRAFVAGIGLAVPCPIPASGDAKVKANIAINLPELRIAIQKHCPDAVVKYENDANAAAMGEAWLGSAKGVQNVVMVTIGTGVGGGVLRDVLAGDTPYIFVKHVYASASLAGALACVVLWPLAGEMAAMLCGSALVVAVRILSAHFRWNLPHAHD